MPATELGPSVYMLSLDIPRDEAYELQCDGHLTKLGCSIRPMARCRQHLRNVARALNIRVVELDDLCVTVTTFDGYEPHESYLWDQWREQNASRIAYKLGLPCATEWFAWRGVVVADMLNLMTEREELNLQHWELETYGQQSIRLVPA